jgi:Carbohydrate-binding module 48 (Isoamylase N-terminal domain)
VSDIEFERRLQAALRAPVPASARAKQAIMEGVRTAAREGAPQRNVFHLGGRAARHSLIGLAMAAGIGSITTMSASTPSAAPMREAAMVSSTVIGDSVVDRVRDTLRLVRLIFDAPAARQVALVGDFNGWQRSATRMERDAHTGRWSVTVALHDGEHRYAVVVDNTRSIRGHAPLRVARSAN